MFNIGPKQSVSRYQTIYYSCSAVGSLTSTLSFTLFLRRECPEWHLLYPLGLGVDSRPGLPRLTTCFTLLPSPTPDLTLGGGCSTNTTSELGVLGPCKGLNLYPGNVTSGSRLLR